MPKDRRAENEVDVRDAAGSNVAEIVSANSPAGSAEAGCAASRAKRGGVLWGVLAVISCPCHLLILAVLLSGTALGSLLQEYFTSTLVLFSMLFVLSLWAFTRARSAIGPSDA